MAVPAATPSPGCGGGAGVISARVASAAAAEGLTLIRSRRAATGFKCVSQNMFGDTHSKPFQLRMWVEGKLVTGGYFATADEAALAYARHIGPEASAREAERNEGLTSAQVFAIAEAEGLVLERANTVSGYSFVSYDSKGHHSGRPYRLQIKAAGRAGKTLRTGTFYTGEEAALEAARYFASQPAASQRPDGTSAHGG